MEKILVTGGAGYIGSHVVKQLGKQGREVLVLDNLSTGFSDAVTTGDLIVGNTGDRDLVTELLQSHGIGTVMHFAASTIVPESVSHPLKYYQNNTFSTKNLLECCINCGVRKFIFSSTAAVYGMPPGGVASEETATSPINPYGMSKLMSERMLQDVAAASDMRYIALRYFNVGGSDPEGCIGQRTPKATLLIKVACEVAVGIRPKLSIYGTDYDTRDGTGVRDYIHVEDLAEAHLKALEYLETGGRSNTLNCGYGHGYSVREVIDMVERIHGRALNVEEADRRPGDPAMLIAEADRIRRILGWEPRYHSLEQIVRTTLNWERNLIANRLHQVNSVA